MNKRNKTIVTVHGSHKDKIEMSSIDWPYDIANGRLGMEVRHNEDLTKSWQESFQIEQLDIGLRLSWRRTDDCHEAVHKLAQIFPGSIFHIDYYDNEGTVYRVDIIRGTEVCFTTEEEGMAWEELVLLQKHEWFASEGDEYPSLMGCPLCSKVAETSQWNKISQQWKRNVLDDLCRDLEQEDIDQTNETASSS